jgi:hypothetical protein
MIKSFLGVIKMGWFGTPNKTKTAIIDECTKGYNFRDDCQEKTNRHIVSECLKYKYVNDINESVLWVVVQQTEYITAPLTFVGKKRFLICNIIEKYNKEWLYKSIDEVAGPCYYSCPLEFLKMTPVKNPEWRKKVENYKG